MVPENQWGFIVHTSNAVVKDFPPHPYHKHPKWKKNMEIIESDFIQNYYLQIQLWHNFMLSQSSPIFLKY